MPGGSFNNHCNSQPAQGTVFPFPDPNADEFAAVIAREINSRIVTQTGMWGRALLLQLAHPGVARAVMEHGRLLSDPASGPERLLRTAETIYALILGSNEEAERVARRLHHIHSRVRGEMPACGGATYRAHDPELLRWVYATLVDSALVSHQRFVRPLSTAEQDAYCRAVRRMGILVGMREEDIPASARELRECVDDMLASPEIAVSQPARTLAGGIFSAPLPGPMRPLRRLALLAAIADLPRSLCHDFGFRRTRSRTVVTGVATAVVPVLQKALPSVPAALRIMRRASSDPESTGFLQRSFARL